MSTINWIIEHGFGTPWIETVIDYSDLSENIIQDGINVFTNAFNKRPTVMVINSEAQGRDVFAINAKLRSMELQLILELAVPSNIIVFAHMADPGDGEFSDVGDEFDQAM